MPSLDQDNSLSNGGKIFVPAVSPGVVRSAGDAIVNLLPMIPSK